MHLNLKRLCVAYCIVLYCVFVYMCRCISRHICIVFLSFPEVQPHVGRSLGIAEDWFTLILTWKMNTLVDKAKLSCAYDDPSLKVRQTTSCKDTKADCGASKEDDIQVTAEHHDHDHLDHYYHLDLDQNRNEFDHHHPGPDHYPHDQLTKSTSRSSDPLEGLGGGTSLPRRASVRDQSPGVGYHIALMYFSVIWIRQKNKVG